MPVVDAVAYLRVSTEGQGADGLGIAAQRAAIESACSSRGWPLVASFEDVASGSSRSRPGLAQALSAVRDAGRGSALVVAKLDRLARSSLHLHEVASASVREGWRLVILDPDFDIGTPAGKLMFSMLGAIAEFERDLIADRTRQALRVARSRGVRLGGNRIESVVSDEVAARIVRLRQMKLSWQEICEVLALDGVPSARGGVWHPNTVRRVYNRALRDAVEGVQFTSGMG